MQEENVSSESNKPIKKRVLDDMEDDEDIGDRSFASDDATNEESEVSSYETKARKDLIDFLTNKGIYHFYIPLVIPVQGRVCICYLNTI
jgi:hypothetical protein